MSLGVRHLTFLGEFKPFGLIAEALDGKPHENHSNTFNYSLFDPKITRQGDDYDSPASDSWNQSDHELFIRGNRIIWSAGSRVLKRYTLESSVIMTVFIEERGQFSPMKDFDERTIWTCDSIPLVASYNKGKMQHSLWLIETAPYNSESSNSKLHDIVPPEVLPKLFSFRRIWQGKGAPSAANKVLMATDDDGVPVICFLLHEQKGLLSLRLQAIEANSETLFDIKPDMSWCIPAIAAASVIVTRPRVKVGLLQFTDIIVLGLENNLLLYSGKKCLCRYILPSGLDKSFLLFSATSSDSVGTCNELKITGLDDSVDGRINVIVNNDQAQLWQLAQRTTALPIGRGAFTLATTSTLLTEALIVPKLVLAVRLPAQQNATV